MGACSDVNKGRNKLKKAVNYGINNSYQNKINNSYQNNNIKKSNTKTTNTKINKNKKSYSKLDINKKYYLKCTKCEKYFPFITKIEYDDKNKDFIISYSCICDSSNKNLKTDYLLNLISLNKPSNECPIHSQNILKFFCKTCNIQYCDKCKDIHKEHEIENNIIFISKENKDNLYKLINEKENEFNEFNLIKKLIELNFNQNEVYSNDDTKLINKNNINENTINNSINIKDSKVENIKNTNSNIDTSTNNNTNKNNNNKSLNYSGGFIEVDSENLNNNNEGNFIENKNNINNLNISNNNQEILNENKIIKNIYKTENKVNKENYDKKQNHDKEIKKNNDIYENQDEGAFMEVSRSESQMRKSFNDKIKIEKQDEISFIKNDKDESKKNCDIGISRINDGDFIANNNKIENKNEVNNNNSKNYYVEKNIKNNNKSSRINKEEIIRNDNQNIRVLVENKNENENIFEYKNKSQKKNYENYNENNNNSFQLLNNDLSISENKQKKYHCIETLKGHEDKVVSLIQLKSGMIATGSYDATIRIWDLEKGLCIKKIQEIGEVFCLLEFKPNMILSSTSQCNIGLRDIEMENNDDDYLCNFLGHELWINCLIKYNEKIFASASNDGTIRIWDYYNNEKEIRKIEAHKEGVLSLIKLNNGNLCSGGADKKIKIFNLEDGKCIKQLVGHKDWVISLSQLDDEIILSGSNDKNIKVWKNFHEISSINAHDDSVRTLCKIDKNYFASGSFDNTIKIWERKNLNCVQILKDHISNVICIIKLNNNNLISCSNDSTIKIWKLS